MIEIKNIQKRYGKLTALNNVSLSLNKGEAISLIGPNGSGKTTLIKCLLGIVISDSGTISINDRDIFNNWDYRNDVGYMPQIGRYPDNMTIGQIFEMLHDLRYKKSKEIDNELIAAFGLDPIMHKRMRTLSGGTRQKVSAAIAFLFHPGILILDEPTAGLDPIASEALKDKIRREKEKGKLILITSHILSDLDDLVSQIIYLQDGNIIFHKSISQLREDTQEQKLSRAIASVMQSSGKHND